PAQRRGADPGAAPGPRWRRGAHAGADPPLVSPARSRLVLACWGMLTLGLAVRALGRGLVGERPGGLSLRPVLVDLNSASVAELATLPGIGRVRAETIVLERIRHGAFLDADDLCRVDGLGSVTA